MSDALRDEFIVDACFGMPGITQGAGCLQLAEDGTFKDLQSEAVYQVWLRGTKHHACSVRDELWRLAKASSAAVDHVEAGHVLAHMQARGLAANNPGG